MATARRGTTDHALPNWIKQTWRLAERNWAGINQDRLLDWAAALTYFGMLSLFPGMIVLISLIGVIGDSATVPLRENLAQFAPGPAREIVDSAIGTVDRAGTKAGAMLAVSLAVALWSASGYIGAFSRASGAIWRQDAHRPFYAKIPIKLAITATVLLLLALIGLIIVFTGPLADQLGRLVGAGDGLVSAWGYLKWPLVLLLMMILLSLLYVSAPDLEHQRFRLITRGSSVAIAIWVVASVLFTIYVSSLASYDRVYGSIAGVIVFLVWLWITNIAILLGVQIDASRAGRRGQSRAGLATDA